MTKSGNTNAQKGDSRRVPWYGMIDPTTKDAIRRLAADLGLSQSEVVDMWRELWEENHIETVKEDKENVRN